MPDDTELLEALEADERRLGVGSDEDALRSLEADENALRALEADESWLSARKTPAPGGGVATATEQADVMLSDPGLAVFDGGRVADSPDPVAQPTAAGVPTMDDRRLERDAPGIVSEFMAEWARNGRTREDFERSGWDARNPDDVREMASILDIARQRGDFDFERRKGDLRLREYAGAPLKGLTGGVVDAARVGGGEMQERFRQEAGMGDRIASGALEMGAAALPIGAAAKGLAAVGAGRAAAPLALGGYSAGATAAAGGTTGEVLKAGVEGTAMGLIAGGIHGRLAPAGSGVAREIAAGAASFPVAGAIVHGGTSPEQAGEEAALGAILTAMGLPAGARARRIEAFRRLRPEARQNVLERYQARQDVETAKINEDVARQRADMGLAEAGRVKQEAVDRGLARPEEAFSEAALRDGEKAAAAGKDPLAAIEAREALPAKGGGTDKGYQPTEQAIAEGNVAPKAVPLVREFEAKGGQAAASGVTDGAPYVIGKDAKGETVVERGEATSIKNRVVNEERAARGVEPLAEPVPETNAGWNAEAARRMEADPGYADSLVRELNASGRGHDKVEAKVLVRHRVNLNKSFESVTAEGLAAARRGDVDAAQRAKERATEIREQYRLAAEAAGKSSGSEVARALGSRKSMMDENYELLAMETQRSERQNYKPLSFEQITETKAIYERVSRTDERVTALEDRFASIAAKRALGKVAARAATTKYGAENKVVSRESYEATKAAVRARLGTLSAGVPLDVLPGLIKMGVFHLEAGARGFARWSAKMVKEAGEAIRPNLRALYSEALKQAPKATDETGLSEAGKIAELVMRDGVKSREAVINEVHSILKETSPEVTRRQVMDAISGYGKVRPLNPDPIKAELRELKGQMQQLAKLADMAAGKAPLKSGPERQAPGDEQRRLIKDVNEAKRAGGYDVRDPASQLRTALDATKTRLTNEIADLDRQIAAGKRDIPQRTRLALDAEATALKAKRDVLKQALDTLDPVGVRQRSDQQRIDAALKATEKSIAEYERKIAAGDISTRQPKPGPTNPALDALRARRDELRDRLDAARAEARKPTPEAIDARRIQNAVKAVERATAEYERRVRENDLEPKRKVDEAFEARKQKALAKALAEREMAREKWRDALERDRLKNLTRWQKVKAIPGATFNFLRAVKTSFDLSALLNQGGILAISNPTLAPRALKSGVSAFASAEAAAQSKVVRMADPDYVLSQRAGLFLGDKASSGPARAEEMFSSRLAEKTPGLAGSGRAYTETLNAMRFPAFKKLIRSFSGGKEPTLAFAKDVANYINIAAGRGHMGRFEGAAPLGNVIFWATRNLVSRVQYLTLQPLRKAETWRGRAVIATEYAKFFAGVAALYAIAKATGAEIGDDPRSSDFGKIRIGNTRVDPYSGLQQVVVLTDRLAEGEKANINGQVRRATVGDTLQRFVRTKAAPVPGAIWSVLDGRGVDYEETTPWSVASDLALPMVVSDVADAIKEHGVAKGAALGALSIFGVRVSTYDTERR